MMLAVAGRSLRARKALAPQQARSFYTVLEKYVESYKRYGWEGTLWKLYNPGDVKFGRLVGEDEFGHKYYEDPTEVYGQHRWTEFKVDSWEEVEGTLIPPQWHLWMHHLTDAVPGQPAQDPANWEKLPISSSSDAPFANHVGEHVPYYPNKTLYRSRGYNVGSLAIGADEPDQYYMQPNHLLRRRKRSPHYFAPVDYNDPESTAHTAEPLRAADLP